MNPLHLWDRLSVAILRLFGFRRVWVPTPVGRVHALVWQGGSGPDLVVIHGIAAHGGHFATVLPWLRRDFRRIVVPDLPGHGSSDIPPVVDGHHLGIGLVSALDALLDRPALLYGNSMGGIAAVRYAQRRPDRVAGLLLNSPGGSPDSDDELAAFLAQFRLSDAAGGRRFFDLLHRRPTWLGWIVGPWIRRKLAQPTIQRLLDGVTQGDLLRPEEVGALRSPIRLLWGVADGLMPRRHFARWHGMLPPHAEVSTPDIGHCPYLDTPWVLVRELRSFAARHASRG